MSSNEKVVLAYARDPDALTSTGTIRTLAGLEVRFAGLPFRRMIYRLSEVLRQHPDAVVELQRTDHENLTPYALDVATVDLIRTDPVAAASAMEVHPSPSTGVKISKAERTLIEAPPLPAGMVTLAEAFGEILYFRVRVHELECPCCGFWGMWAIPAMLKDPDRAGAIIKTIFVCPKKCRLRFPVTCDGGWGWVHVEDLLKLQHDRFYFPREWNVGGPWIGKDDLRQKYATYVQEKEQLT